MDRCVWVSSVDDGLRSKIIQAMESMGGSVRMLLRNSNVVVPKKFVDKSLSSFSIPAGLFKNDWLRKHSEDIPSAVLMVVSFSDNEANDSVIDKQITSMKTQLDPHQIPLLVVLHHVCDHPSGFETPQKQERIATRKQFICSRADHNIRNIFVLYSSEVTPISSPLQEIFQQFMELSLDYYSGRLKRLLGFKSDLTANTKGVALAIRHNLKIAFFQESLNVIDRAMKHYEIAYASLISLAKLPDCPYSGNEIKTVAELIHDRICDIYLQANRNVKGLSDQFSRHISSFMNVTGPEHLMFQHWGWMSKQHLNFARILKTLGSSVSMAGLPILQKLRCEPMYHLRLAAKYAIKRRQVHIDIAEGYSDTKSLYIGVFTDEESFASESKVNRSQLVFDLLCQVIVKDKRSAAAITIQLADEKILLGRYSSALQDLLGVYEVYHKEKWFSLLTNPLLSVLHSASQVLQTEDSDILDNVASRRHIIHCALQALGVMAIDKEKKIEIASSLMGWMIQRPLLKDMNPLLKMGFSLDALEICLIQWNYRFSAYSVMVGSTVEFFIDVTSQFPVPVVFEELSIIFNDTRYEIHLFNESPSSSLAFEPNTKRTFCVNLPIMNHPKESNLVANQLQLKLKNYSQQVDNKSSLSGVSLWCKQRHTLNSAFQFQSNTELLNQLVTTPVITEHIHNVESAPNVESSGSGGLCIFPYKSLIEMRLEHLGYALVGEMYPLKLVLTGDQLANSQIWLRCDPPVKSKSTPFFYFDKDTPIPLDNDSLQPNVHLCNLEFFCKFGSLPFSTSSTREQARQCIVTLKYNLECGIPVESCQTFTISCGLPFTSQIQVIEYGLPNPVSSCFVDLDIQCSDTIEVLGIHVEPASVISVNETPTGDKYPLIDLPVVISSGDRMSLGFTCAAGDESPQTEGGATLGCVAVQWQRRAGDVVAMYIPLPKPALRYSEFKFKMAIEKNPRIGDPFLLQVDIENSTSMFQELDVSIEESLNFVFHGSQAFSMSLAPGGHRMFQLLLVPLGAGNLRLPNIRMVSTRMNYTYSLPLDSESLLFVTPN